MKRFVAALLLAVLVMSMCNIALAECINHRWDVLKGGTTYIKYTTFQHKRISEQWFYCSICGERYVNPKQYDVVVENHKIVRTRKHLPIFMQDRITQKCTECGFEVTDTVPCECYY